MRRMFAIVPLISLFVASMATATFPLRSVPPARSTAMPMQKAQGSLLLGAAASALQIALTVPTAAELATLKVAPVTGAKAKPASIGFGRDVPAGERTIALASLNWQPTAEGGRAAQIVITSPSAAALRVALQMQLTDPDVVIRMQGSAAQAKVIGPIAANAIAEATARMGEWWSPILEGSSATLEIAVSASVDVAKSTLTLSRVSHLTRAGAALAPSVAKLTGIGTSGSCEIDWKCEAPSPTLTNSANAVARMVFTVESGDSYLCSGTLVNDSIASQTPYLFTADHCIDSDYTASTLNTYWFYDSQACGSNTPAQYVLLSGGATMLGRSVAEDWVVVRLNQPAPVGTYFSAWNADPVSSGAVIDLHHPSGDLKKWSAGSLTGYETVELADDSGDPQINYTAARVVWSQGVTEPGSSGSGLLTFLASGNYFELRGGLSGGESSCSAQHAPDYYSRFDQMLPKMRDYLAPGTNAPNEAIVVEYYNQSLNHYFMTQNPVEINDLDTGLFVGWERTGLRFLAYTTQVPGTNPVCRFYRAPGFGDSHFYSASPAECAVIVNNPAYPGWILESSNVFYIALPSASGACASGTHPLWRFFHTTATNHRYTDDISIRDTLRADPDWIAEGYGSDAVIMCAPNGV
ncbi:MAG: trypsin-like peptidase domain-containing protein [Casimicrobiaceae bacterium]